MPCSLLSKEWPMISKYAVLHNVVDVMNIRSASLHRAVYYIYIFVLYTSMKWLLYQEFNLSQGTCGFLEKLLILFRHFILQFMYLPSARRPTVVLPQTWHWQWSMNMLTQKFLKRPVSVVNTSKQQLYQRCKIKCLTEFVVIRTNSHCIPVWQRVLTQISLVWPKQ